MSNAANHQYDAIINLPHHISATHPRMSMHDRAAQFSPFAALTGYEMVIQEAGRLTDQRIELTEGSRMELDRKQQRLAECLCEHPEVTVTYYIPDERKTGGAYVTVTGSVKKIDIYRRQIYMSNGTGISFDEIAALESEIF